MPASTSAPVGTSPFPSALASTAASPGVSVSSKLAEAETWEFKPLTTGLTFNLPSGGQPTFGFTTFFHPQIAMRFDMGWKYQESVDPASGQKIKGTESSFELGVRGYFKKTGRVRPFFQPGYFMAKTGQEPNDVDTNAYTTAVGAECVLIEGVTLSGATGFAVVSTPKTKQSSTTSGTSALSVNFYWSW